MEISETTIPGVLILDPGRHEDERGWLSELWNPATSAAAGLDLEFVQDNQSHNPRAGVVRALHFQAPPHDQGKLVICLAGAVFDVAVDLRQGSPTYGQHVGVELRGDSTRQLWVPSGCAHGYSVLQDGSRVLYKLTAPYAPEANGGILWNDPALGIDWHLEPGREIVNSRDTNWPVLAEFESPFRWSD